MTSTNVSAGGAVMTKPPPIVENHNLQTLHAADQPWVGNHQQSPTQPVQRSESVHLHHSGSMITDEIRFSIIDAVYLRPGIWDCQREKTVGPSRKELFVEVTNLINQQNQLDPELTPEEVEKQWKNLKDTYVKTRKKVLWQVLRDTTLRTPTCEVGLFSERATNLPISSLMKRTIKLSYNNDTSMPVTPKWKFYSSLMFLDDLFSVHRNVTKRRIDEVSGSSQVLRTDRSYTDDEDSKTSRCSDLSSSHFPAESFFRPQNAIVHAKRIPPPPSEDAEDEDEYMAFCRSLLHPLREIAYKDRIQYLKVQKAIRDLLHDAQMDMLLTHMR